MVLEKDHCRMVVAVHGIRARARRAVGFMACRKMCAGSAPPAYPFLATMIFGPALFVRGLKVGTLLG
jgi:hypothetical protein